MPTFQEDASSEFDDKASANQLKSLAEGVGGDIDGRHDCYAYIKCVLDLLVCTDEEGPDQGWRYAVDRALELRATQVSAEWSSFTLHGVATLKRETTYAGVAV